MKTPGRVPQGGILLNGGADRDRTCDLLIANETLYQLSYDPTQNRRDLTIGSSMRTQAETPEFSIFCQMLVVPRFAKQRN